MICLRHHQKNQFIEKKLYVKNNDKFKEIQIGTWNCDGAVNYFFKDQIVYECLTIKSYHVHFCNERSEKDHDITY